MKLPILLAAWILATPISVAGEIEDDIREIEIAAGKEYEEKYSELIKSGQLDPPAGWGFGEPDSLERRLWTAGYYAAVVALLDPAKAKKARHPGLVEVWGRGVGRFFNHGGLAGQTVACEKARDLYMSIFSRRMGEADARIANKERAKKAKIPAAEREK